MKPEVFDDLVCKIFTRCQETLAVKKDEYSEGRDRLDQFKKGAQFRGKDPLDICAGMMLKHTTSIYDLINKYCDGGEVGIGMWEEKVIDHINYLCLLMGLICDDAKELPE